MRKKKFNVRIVVIKSHRGKGHKFALICKIERRKRRD
jgi:hypothetical protein